MEIIYLKQLEKNPIIFENKIEGISEEQILSYETQLEIAFPLAYKEFLYLAGKYSGDLMLLEGTSSIEDLADKEFQSILKRLLDFGGVSIERPHWIFTTGSETVLFFYLDEITEDPKVWQIDVWAEGQHEIFLSKAKQPFSAYIGDVVDYSKQYYKEMY